MRCSYFTDIHFVVITLPTLNNNSKHNGIIKHKSNEMKDHKRNVIDTHYEHITWQVYKAQVCCATRWRWQRNGL